MHETLRIAGMLLAAGCLTLPAPAQAADTALPPAEAAFFTDRVLPILRTRCFDCHAHDTEINGGLALDVRSGWETGGSRGRQSSPASPTRAC